MNWIDVKDRLPENGKEVWVKLNKPTVYHGQFPNAYYDSEWLAMNDCSLEDEAMEIYVEKWREID